MSSSTPADSEAPGMPSPDSDVPSGEPALSDGAFDSDDGKPSPAHALLTEEHVESSASEVDKLPSQSEAQEPDVSEKRGEESEEETEQLVQADDMQSDEEETQKLNGVSKGSSVEEQISTNDVQVSEEETRKPDTANEAQASANRTEEEATQLGVSESVAAKNEEKEEVAVGTETTDTPLRQEPSSPVYERDIPQKRRFTRYWILSVAL
ncbi:MAG: hypothetical protein JO031_06335, partial [Ktedonobacteraceae bacterium]|nr:hypothetical protein [Ktedonobacteraceae bacterium]